ncbi:unnamed protein product [Adineta steineri]|uniref:Uncharacterized protein n=1 Tax=Adineta steineri TaxID=433720 RepID=A0A813ZJH9_9BILA|nr:unnamed protein product [Adineta steineri]CAF1130645.1 unnamed protein product [Adineta steineri]
MTEQNLEEDNKIESLSSNDVLTTIYDVNRAIFRHLPIHSIDLCSLVCKSWAHVGHLIKTHRHTIHSLTYPTDPLSTIADSSYLLSDFDTFISCYIHIHLWSIPYLALVVTTNSLDRKGFHSSSDCSLRPAKYPRRSHSQTTASQTERHNISEALIHHVNKSCKVLTVVSDGIIASNDKNQSNEIELNDAVGILLLPKFPPNILGIYPFEITNKTPISNNMSRSDLHQLLGCVPDDISIRCVILFYTPRLLQTQMNNCIKKLLEYYSSEVVIIGGYINRSRYDDRQSKHKTLLNNACGLVLTGDRTHLNIRQVVLKSHIQTREAVRDKLKELKSIENEQCYLSFGIQVSCVGRGVDFYHQESNVECSEFQKLFPNTSLIGIFGNGELGHDYLLNDNEASQQQQRTTKESLKDLFHTYSTIFSIISLRM